MPNGEKTSAWLLSDGTSTLPCFKCPVLKPTQVKDVVQSCFYQMRNAVKIQSFLWRRLRNPSMLLCHPTSTIAISYIPVSVSQKMLLLGSGQKLCLLPCCTICALAVYFWRGFSIPLITFWTFPYISGLLFPLEPGCSLSPSDYAPQATIFDENKDGGPGCWDY